MWYPQKYPHESPVPMSADAENIPRSAPDCWTLADVYERLWMAPRAGDKQAAGESIFCGIGVIRVG